MREDSAVQNQLELDLKEGGSCRAARRGRCKGKLSDRTPGMMVDSR